MSSEGQGTNLEAQITGWTRVLDLGGMNAVHPKIQQTVEKFNSDETASCENAVILWRSLLPQLSWSTWEQWFHEKTSATVTSRPSLQIFFSINHQSNYPILLTLNVNACYKWWQSSNSKPYGTAVFECNYSSLGKYIQTCLAVVLADLHIVIECAVSLDWGLRSLIDPQNSVFLRYTKQCVNLFLQISLWPILMWSLLVSTPANNTRPWLLNYRASLFTLTPCSPAGAQPASCCQSNTDTHMPLQLTERKRSISGIYTDLYFFLSIIHMLLKISLISKQRIIFDCRKGMTICDISWK